MTLQLLSLVLLVSVAAPAAIATFDQTGTGRQGGGARTRDVHVSVLDSSGKPVTGLTAADFTVREDGAVREVLKAGPATAPLTISVLIDDSQAADPAIQDLREGLTAFVKSLDGKGEIALATIGERPTPLLDYTGSTEQLTQTVNRLFARPGAGAYLLDGLIDVSRGLAKREAERKVIVVLTIESGVEFSNRYYETVLDELQKSGATMHVLAIGSPASSLEDEMRNRNMVISEGLEKTGGRRDQLLSMRAITPKLQQLADELKNQYVVTYSRPETLIPPEKLEVSVQRPGVTVRAPKRAGR